MITWAILASGQSLTKEDVELVRRAREANIISGVIAVSNVGLDFAPWADILLSHDSAWWSTHPKAFEFKGKKIGGNSVPRGGELFKASINGCNSGLMAMEYARDVQRANKLILLGFDMHGTHYFGKHYNPRLKNTSKSRFQVHISQFDRWYGSGVVNCTPNSALKRFTFQPLAECLIDVQAIKL